MELLRKIWRYLTNLTRNPNLQDFRVYITRVILYGNSVIALLLTSYIVVGLLSGMTHPVELTIIIIIDLLIALSFFLFGKGHWRAASLVLILMFIALGTYARSVGGYPITGILAFVTAILLAGILASPTTLMVVIAVCIAIDSTLTVILENADFLQALTGAVSLLGMFAGIAFIQWLAIHQLRNVIQRAEQSSLHLQDEIERHRQTQTARQDILREYELTMQHIRNDIFRLRRNPSGDVIIMLFEGRISRANGLSTASTGGKSLRSILPEYAAVQFWPIILRAFEGEEQNCSIDLSEHSFSISATPIRDGDQIIEVAGSISDITEQTQIEKEKRLFQQKMQFFIDNSPMGLTEIDPSGKILTWNRSARLIFGYTAEEAIGKQITDLLVPASQRKNVYYLLKSVFDNRLAEKIVVDNVTREGLIIKCEWVNNPILNENNKPISILTTIQEITSRLQAESLQRALYHISEAASKTRNLEELYKSVHKIIGELVSARNFYIALLTPDQKQINFVYFVDEIDPSPVRTAMRKGLTEYVLNTGQPALVDPQRFEELVALGQVQNQGAPSVDWLGVPLIDENRLTFGVIAIQTYTEGERFNRNHLNILNFVSNQIASAILRKQAAEQLVVSEEKYRNFVEQTRDAMILFDEKANIVEVNHSTELLTGYSRSDLLGLNAWAFYKQLLPNDRRKQAFSDIMNNPHIMHLFDGSQPDENVILDSEIRTRNNEIRYIQQSLFPIKTESSYRVGMLSRDITDQKRIEEELRESEERYRGYLENQGEGSAFVDVNEQVIYANPAADALFGVEKGSLVGRSICDFLDEQEQAKVRQQTGFRIKGKKSTYELVITLPDQTQRTLLVTASPQFDRDGEFFGTISLFHDITERKQYEDRLRYFSMYDSLTHIHNRAFFDTEIDRISQSSQFPVSVMVIDVDDLKTVNDRMGHATGDELLKQTADLLRTSVRDGDTVARIGGDEFAIILPETNRENAAKLKKRIEYRIKEYNEFQSNLPVNISIGIGTGNQNDDLSQVVRSADERMFREKARKKQARNKPQ